MDTTFLSLLYPTSESRDRQLSGEGVPHITLEVAEELGLTRLIPLKNSVITDYFTSDPEVMAYRAATLADMEKHPALGETLSRLLPILSDIEELRRLDRARGENAGESYLYSITEIELYVTCIDTLYAGLSSLREELTSPAFSTLADFVISLAEGDYYRELNESLKKLASRASEIHSVTIGVNLDAEFRPVEAGVLSLNADTFKGGRVLDKILRMSWKNDSMTTIAPLTPVVGKSDHMREAMVSAFRGAIEEVFRTSVRAWRGIVGGYVLEKTDFLLRLLPEIEFVTRVTALTETLTQKGYPLTYPTILPKEEKGFSAVGLYNPDVALRIEGAVVENDLAFDENAHIYVLTGPNRGGKSVITCALGLAQGMAQLGMRVPAREASLSVVDGIYTHFPEGAEDTIDKGRLGEECARLRDIFDHASGESMILLDESLSSTGAYEAAFIASEILAGFAILGCRGIFSTHLHDLAAGVDEINARVAPYGGVKLDTLVAGIEEGERSFRIHRTKPDGKSYARDIAEKYGLSLEETLRHLS